MTGPSCPVCGTLFVPDVSPAGLCPACLLGNAFSNDRDANDLPEDSSRHEITNLLRAARDGSSQALSELYERLSGRLLALIRLRMGRDLRARLESRDILQNTLMKSFQRLDQFEGGNGGSLMAWLAKIAENEIRDQADAQHRQRRDVARGISLDETGIEVPASLRSAISHAVLSEQTQRLEQALEALEPAHREIIVLRRFEELSFREIALRMRRSDDACRMLLARALTALTLKMRAIS
jgi:RNA polymerase sigma-70 factor (ECF subfamily)